MPIVVNVLSAEKYAAWANERKQKLAALGDDPNKAWTLDELKSRGEKVFAQNCAACHQATGMGVPGAFPALNGSPIVNGPKDGQINVLLNGIMKDGKPTAMLSFKQLSDVELAAVITYTRNNWNNKVGDTVSPAEIKSARAGKSAAAAPSVPSAKLVAATDEVQVRRAQLASSK